MILYLKILKSQIFDFFIKIVKISFDVKLRIFNIDKNVRK